MHQQLQLHLKASRNVHQNLLFPLEWASTHVSCLSESRWTNCLAFLSTFNIDWRFRRAFLAILNSNGAIDVRFLPLLIAQEAFDARFQLLHSLPLLAVAVASLVLIPRDIKLVGGGQLQASVVLVLLIKIAGTEDGYRLMVRVEEIASLEREIETVVEERLLQESIDCEQGAVDAIGGIVATRLTVEVKPNSPTVRQDEEIVPDEIADRSIQLHLATISTHALVILQRRNHTPCRVPNLKERRLDKHL